MNIVAPYRGMLWHDRRSFLRLAAGLLAGGSTVLLGSGCDGDTTAPRLGEDYDEPSSDDQTSGRCSIDEGEIFQGAARDAIPALSDPPTRPARHADHDYLDARDRVIGVFRRGDVVAVPLNLLWWHEIVNLHIGGGRAAITHCPLTGSSLVFDTEAIGGVDLGVSGLLYRNNLIMYDRVGDDSLWPQMLRRAACGPTRGTVLPMLPSIEMTWARWRELYPEAQVVTSDTGFTRSYRVYPYFGYDVEDNTQLLFPLPREIDSRRPPKERVLGIAGTGAIGAFPFGFLDGLGPIAAVHDGDWVVFWDGQGQAAAAYHRRLDGELLAFETEGSTVLDRGTGSAWSLDGLAVSGPLEGRRLDPVAEAFVAYWFAWAAFNPNSFVLGEE